jgi:deazaflavin-dependent oxidoreductase (nitroreductase family)
MREIVGVIVAVVIVAVAVIGVVFVVGMRRRSPVVLGAVRRFSRTVVNPRMLKTAGTPGAYASLIHHVGRRTGRAYRTPVVAAPTADGFVIALPYGTTSNWVRNVLASGSATLVHEGTTHSLDRPEIVPLGPVNEHFPQKERRSHTRFRVEHCMRLRRADRIEPSP